MRDDKRIVIARGAYNAAKATISALSPPQSRNAAEDPAVAILGLVVADLFVRGGRPAIEYIKEIVARFETVMIEAKDDPAQALAILEARDLLNKFKGGVPS